MEVVTLSCGPYSGWLNAKFYNKQTNYFVYSDAEAKNSKVDPKVRWSFHRQSLRPRAVYWDFKEGFGRGTQFTDIGSNSLEQPLDVSLSKPEPQNALWINNCQYPPSESSLHELADWSYTPTGIFGIPRGATPDQNAQINGFSSFEQGAEAFTVANRDSGGDFIDFYLHSELEKCDKLEGFTVVTDFSGWGGWSCRLLAELRDEIGAKNSIQTWAAYWDQRPKCRTIKEREQQAASELEIWLGLSEYSSLLLPMQSEVELWNRTPGLAARDQNIVFETVSLLQALRNTDLSANSLPMMLEAEPEGRNIASISLSLQKDPAPLPLNDPDPWAAIAAYNATAGGSETVKSYHPASFEDCTHVAARVGIARSTGLKELDEQQLVDVWKTFMDTPQSTYSRDCKYSKILCSQPLAEAMDEKSIRVNIDIDNGPRGLRKLLPKWDHELRERVYTLTEPYDFSPEHDSDYD